MHIKFTISTTVSPYSDAQSRVEMSIGGHCFDTWNPHGINPLERACLSILNDFLICF